MKKGLLLFTLIIFQISYGQTVAIPDANFKAALIADGVDTNNDGEIQVSEAESRIEINVSSRGISSLEGISSFINLIKLDCSRNNLTSIDVSQLSSLQTFHCNVNQLALIDISALPLLRTLDCSSNKLTYLDVSQSSFLELLNCSENQLTALNISQISSLQTLNCYNNQLTVLDVSQLSSLETFNCSQNQFTSLDVSQLSSLKTFYCGGNQLTSLDVSQLVSLENFYCNHNLLTSINLPQPSSLIDFRCNVNQLTSLDISQLLALQTLSCDSNQLTSLDVSQLSDLSYLNCNHNLLTSISLSKPSALEAFYCSYNQLSSLDVSQSPVLRFFYCNNNEITYLDLSEVPSLRSFICSDNKLEHLITKNGEGFSSYYDFSNNSTLEYICTDQNEEEKIQNLVNSYGYTNCVVNTYCSFIPGGDPSYITGNVRLDLNANGCDSNDIGFGDLKLKITNSQNVSDTYTTNADGSYNIALPEDNYTIEYVLENPSYFNVSPTSFVVDFATDASPYQQDFCLTANNVVQDLEIQIIPLELARPGFDADYRIVYKNNGTSTVSGNVTLTYDDNVMDLVSSTPNFSSATQGFLSWTYTDLTPSETREILITMNLNTPMETPPLNGDEILCYEASITPTANDQRVNDNTFILKQTVVNSYDPNDKTCLEGNTVTPDLIGEFVHYLIRFENTGTASAVNVVVKDVIDTDKFDISTMVIYDSSHDLVTRIQNTNEVEFIFEGINLPFDDANNDGYIAFKIKTLSSLVVGDTFENNAEIYFDFNFPIITNTEQTTIENTASVDDVFAISDVQVFPNPTRELLTIKSSVNFDSVTIYDLKGRQLQMISSTAPQLTKQIDITHLASGIYYLSVQSGASKKLLKIVKK